MIRLENVNYKYKNSDYILKNLNITFNDGEIVAIVGKNGAGKSSLGKLISGIIKLKEGKIFIDNIDISDKKHINDIREKIGVVFQNPENQILFNSIYDEIAFSLKNCSKEEINNRIETALKQVDMSGHKDDELYSLSLGQKQRIVIAEILAKNPKYIVLDEPTSMIDSSGKHKIYDIIKNLKKEGYTIICITNISDEILLADRILILDNCKIAHEIRKEEILDKMDILAKYDIKLPTILEIISKLKQNGIELNLNDYTVEELTENLKGKILNERYN